MDDGYQSRTFVGSYRGRKAVIKRILHPGIPLLRSVEDWVLYREVKALRILRHVPQVPGYLGRPDPHSLAMEFVEGETLRKRDPESLSASFFEELADAVERIHELGVVHSDLKKKENILVTPRESPVLLDFGASFFRPSGVNPLRGWLYQQFKQIDRNAVAKYKQRYCPDILSEAEEEGLAKPVLLERISRLGNRYLLFRTE